MLSTLKPGALVGTRKALMPPALRSAFAASVMANTMHQSAVGLLVVQSFRPVMRQPLSVRTARVLIMLASEPAPGSDRPKHIDVSPDIMPARQRFEASRRHLGQHPARPERPVRDHPGRQDGVRAEAAVDRFPGDVIGEVAEAAAAEFLRRAHREKAGLRRQRPRFADQALHIRRIAPALVVEFALVLEQRVVVFHARHDLRLDKAHDAVAHGEHVLRQVECDRRSCRRGSFFVDYAAARAA